MGTRGVVGFKVDGQVKASYNHADSYPESLGSSVLDWALGASVERELERARAVQLIRHDSPAPTDGQRNELGRYENKYVAGNSDHPFNQWYRLLRNTQGFPNAMLDAGYMLDEASFVFENCMWGYITNFDTNQLEVYAHRGVYAELPDLGTGVFPMVNERGEQLAVKLVAAWPFSALPSHAEFMRVLVDAQGKD